MKSSRMLLLLAVTMMSAINAKNNPNVVQLEQFMTGNFVNEKQQSWAHMLALHCNNPEVELRIKPLVIAEKIEAEAKLLYPDVPKTIAFILYMEFLGTITKELVFSQDTDGMTPFDILEKQECKTELCDCIKEEFRQAMQQKENKKK